MHGLVANQLRGYVVARYGREAWSHAIRASGTSLPHGPPPLDVTVADGELVAVMVSVAAAAETDIPSLLNEFGVFLAPGLLRIYAPLIQPGWRTLDVIEHVEEEIHTAVRLRDREADPPYLVARRRSPTAVEITYTSPRQLCRLAEGIVRGLAEHFDERVAVTQRECMLRGDARCLIAVDLVLHQGKARDAPPRRVAST